MWRDLNAICLKNFIPEFHIFLFRSRKNTYFLRWIDDNFLNLKEVIEKTEHGKLLKIEQYQIHH